MRYRYTNLFAVLTVPLIFLSVFFAGAGHGNYALITVIFPLCFLGIILPDNISMYFLVFGILQFAIYGNIIDRFGGKKSLPFILAAHFLFIIIGFMATNNSLF
ncbi:hypothetical protein PFY10_20600 [Chryseobacterium daecheongense]|nr:hypothetical protein PFY10_20600 [Chryseobacterium daecheongense]